MRLLRLKRAWLILLLPLSLGLVALAGEYPAATEALYSRGLFPLLIGSFGRLSSLLPFSLAEWLSILFPTALFIYIIRKLVLAARSREQRWDRLARLVANLLCLAGVGYFLFVFLCGFNYHRESFTVASGLAVRPSSTEELAALCDELVGRANELRAVVAEDDQGVMTASFVDYYDTAAFARTAYGMIGEIYPELGGYTVRPKPIVLSRAMSYLDITGIYMPYTFEANVNVDVPAFWVPSTMMHELAHSKGYMREDEANFISFLACTTSGNADFAYSGTVLALIHSTNALYSADKDLYWPLREKYCEGIDRDMAANAAYWKQFEGPVAEVSTAVNNAYLRSNRQTEGVRSYGRMVDLLLADYRLRHGLE